MQDAGVMSTTRLAARWTLGRRTIRIPEILQKRVVRSARGLIEPRLPTNTRIAGSTPTAATERTRPAMEVAGPASPKPCSLANTITMKVIDTVAADAAITLPMDVTALMTPWSE